MDRRLTFTATRESSITANATPRARSPAAEKPARAPSLVHRSPKTAPASTTAALASHGSTCCRRRPASRVSRLGAATLWPLAADVDAVHLASPVWQYRAIAVTA